jgi:peptidoglycan/LPS O-acetylase OafA/YrhL
MSARATRFPLFDSLRAIAALAVVTTHVGVATGLYDGHSVVGQYVARLEVGYPIFFLISGFLLYRPFVRARLLGERLPEVRAYAWRRFLRIAPAYWVALTLVALWMSLPGVFSERGLRDYFLLQNYDESTFGTGLVQAWTLCIEFAFYVFLPFYALLMRALPARGREGRLKWEVAGLVVLFVTAVVWKLAVLSTGDPKKVAPNAELIALPAYLDQFALGMGFAVLSVWLQWRERLPRWLAPLDRFPSLAWGFALVAFWVVCSQIGFTGRFFEPHSNTQYMERHLLFAAVAVGLIAPAVIGDQSRGIVRRILANRVLLYLGLISYGIYLYGASVSNQLLDWNFHSIVPDTNGLGILAFWLLPTVAGAVLLATLSYFLLERRALSLKRLVGSRQPQASEAIAEPVAVAPPPIRSG